MKTVVVLVISLLALTVAAPSYAGNHGSNSGKLSQRKAKALYSQCDRLEDVVESARRALVRAASKNGRLAAHRKRLNGALKAFGRCEQTGEVCGNEQPALCAAAGAEICIQLVREKQYSSMAELVRAGAGFLYMGQCGSDGSVYGMPQFTGR